MKFYICRDESGRCAAFTGEKPIRKEQSNGNGYWESPDRYQKPYLFDVVDDNCQAWYYSEILVKALKKYTKDLTWTDEPIEVEIDAKKVNQNPKYIDFGVAKYALPQVCEALWNNGVKDAFLTLEDDEIHVRWKYDINRFIHQAGRDFDNM